MNAHDNPGSHFFCDISESYAYLQAYPGDESARVSGHAEVVGVLL